MFFLTTIFLTNLKLKLIIETAHFNNSNPLRMQKYKWLDFPTECLHTNKDFSWWQQIILVILYKGGPIKKDLSSHLTQEGEKLQRCCRWEEKQPVKGCSRSPGKLKTHSAHKKRLKIQTFPCTNLLLYLLLNTPLKLNEKTSLQWMPACAELFQKHKTKRQQRKDGQSEVRRWVSILPLIEVSSSSSTAFLPVSSKH